MVKPSLLSYVPPIQFADDTGIPFTLSAHTATRYLSVKYPHWIVDSIISLGVRQLSSKGFLEDLKSIVSNNPETFQKKPLSWHAQLAKALIPLSTEPSYRSLLLNLCIIPLWDGRWTSAEGRTIFFSEGVNSLYLPKRIGVLIVDPTAEADLNRRNLFAHLGIRAFESSEICRVISQVHAAPSDPPNLSRAQLIDHVTFFFRASWQPPKHVDLRVWFVTTNDELCRGSHLYLPRDFGKHPSASHLLFCFCCSSSFAHILSFIHGYMYLHASDSLSLQSLNQS